MPRKLGISRSNAVVKSLIYFIRGVYLDAKRKKWTRNEVDIKINLHLSSHPGWKRLPRYRQSEVYGAIDLMRTLIESDTPFSYLINDKWYHINTPEYDALAQEHVYDKSRYGEELWGAFVWKGTQTPYTKPSNVNAPRISYKHN